MAKDFSFTVTDPDRVNAWLEMLGTKTVHVTSPIPEWAELPGYDEPQLVYMVDMELITPKQREQMISYVCTQFKLDRETVEKELDDHGMPVLAEHGTIKVQNPQKWFD